MNFLLRLFSRGIIKTFVVLPSLLALRCGVGTARPPIGRNELRIPRLSERHATAVNEDYAVLLHFVWRQATPCLRINGVIERHSRGGVLLFVNMLRRRDSRACALRG